jgi:hypothetical protein
MERTPRIPRDTLEAQMSTAEQVPTAALVPELQRYVNELEAQKSEVELLLRPLSETQLNWRPAEQKWSIGENLEHLAISLKPYRAILDLAIDKARADGLLSQGPYRHGFIGRWFLKTMEPPVNFKVKTFAPLVPPRGVPREQVITDFATAMDEVIQIIRRANGIDIGKASVRSPFVKALRLSVGQVFHLFASHNRRHLWLIRQLMALPEFPRHG